MFVRHTCRMSALLSTPSSCNRVTTHVPSWSWTQPPSRGIGGWEGRCGQTCVSNLLMNTSPSRRLSPEQIIRLGGDLGPGTLPKTLLGLVKGESRSNRDYILSSGSIGAINFASANMPMGCLLQWKTNVLHWVTVVQANSAHVVFNHWGRQEKWTRTKFNEHWGFRKQGAVDTAISILGGLTPYTAVV